MSDHLSGTVSSEKEIAQQDLSTLMFKAALEAAYTQPESALPSSAHILTCVRAWHITLAGLPVGLLLPQSCASEADSEHEELTQDNRMSWINIMVLQILQWLRVLLHRGNAKALLVQSLQQPHLA